MSTAHARAAGPWLLGFFFVNSAAETLQGVALLFATYELTKDTSIVGAINAAAYLPGVVVGLMARKRADKGHAAGRLSRTNWSLLCGSTALALGWFSGASAATVLVMFAVVQIVLGLVKTFNKAYVGRLVRERFDTGEAVRLLERATSFGLIGGLAGGSVSGLVLDGPAAGWCFAGAAALYLMSLIAVRMAVGDPRAAARTSAADDAAGDGGVNGGTAGGGSAGDAPGDGGALAAGGPSPGVAGGTGGGAVGSGTASAPGSPYGAADPHGADEQYGADEPYRPAVPLPATVAKVERPAPAVPDDPRPKPAAPAEAAPVGPRALRMILGFSLPSSGALPFLTTLMVPLAAAVAPGSGLFYSMLSVTATCGGFVAGLLLSSGRLSMPVTLNGALLAACPLVAALAFTGSRVAVVLLMALASLVVTAHVMAMQVLTNQAPPTNQVGRFTMVRNAVAGSAKGGFSLLAGWVTDLAGLDTAWWVLAATLAVSALAWWALDGPRTMSGVAGVH